MMRPVRAFIIGLAMAREFAREGANVWLVDREQSVSESANQIAREFNVPFDEDALPDIWTYGHRNIQGLAIDPESGRVYASEHGPFGGDELNRIEGGENYGWPLQTEGRDYRTRRPVGEPAVVREQDRAGLRLQPNRQVRGPASVADAVEPARSGLVAGPCVHAAHVQVAIGRMEARPHHTRGKRWQRQRTHAALCLAVHLLVRDDVNLAHAVRRVQQRSSERPPPPLRSRLQRGGWGGWHPDQLRRRAIEPGVRTFALEDPRDVIGDRAIKAPHDNGFYGRQKRARTEA